MTSRANQIALLHAFTSLAIAALRAGDASSTHAGVVALDSNDTPIGLMNDLAYAAGFDLCQIFMHDVGTGGDAVRAVRRKVEQMEGSDTLFLLHHAFSAPEDMLERTVRVIREATTSGHSIILALSGLKDVSIDGMARDVADGMAAAPGSIIGSSSYKAGWLKGVREQMTSIG